MTDKEKDKRIEKLKKSIVADKADNCIGCPMFSPDGVSDCTSNVMNVAANIIDRLETESAALREKLAAAIEACRGYCETCKFREDCAKHDNNDAAPPTWHYGDCEDWEYRGGQEVEKGE